MYGGGWAKTGVGACEIQLSVGALLRDSERRLSRAWTAPVACVCTMPEQPPVEDAARLFLAELDALQEEHDRRQDRLSSLRQTEAQVDAQIRQLAKRRRAAETLAVVQKAQLVQRDLRIRSLEAQRRSLLEVAHSQCVEHRRLLEVKERMETAMADRKITETATLLPGGGLRDMARAWAAFLGDELADFFASAATPAELTRLRPLSQLTSDEQEVAEEVMRAVAMRWPTLALGASGPTGTEEPLLQRLVEGDGAACCHPAPSAWM